MAFLKFVSTETYEWKSWNEYWEANQKLPGWRRSSTEAESKRRRHKLLRSLHEAIGSEFQILKCYRVLLCPELIEKIHEGGKSGSGTGCRMDNAKEAVMALIPTIKEIVDGGYEEYKKGEIPKDISRIRCCHHSENAIEVIRFIQGTALSKDWLTFNVIIAVNRSDINNITQEPTLREWVQPLGGHVEEKTSNGTQRRRRNLWQKWHELTMSIGKTTVNYEDNVLRIAPHRLALIRVIFGSLYMDQAGVSMLDEHLKFPIDHSDCNLLSAPFFHSDIDLVALCDFCRRNWVENWDGPSQFVKDTHDFFGDCSFIISKIDKVS